MSQRQLVTVPATLAAVETSAIAPIIRAQSSVASVRFWTTHLVLPLAAFVAALIAFQNTGIDVDVAQAWAYDTTLHRWLGRGSWWADILLHRDGRDAILLVVIALLTTLLLGPFSKRLRAARGTTMYLLLSIVLAWGLVGGLKHVTNLACPWDLQGFGGDRPHIALFDARPPGFRHAACFPGAHSGSGFSLFAFYFAFRDRRPRAAKTAFGIALATGAVFAFGQEARGAHFISHDVTSAFVVWFAALATYISWRRRTCPDSGLANA